MAKDLFVCALLDVYGGFLSEKQQRLADHYYNEDLSLGEIAENEGITRQGVGDLIKRAETQLRQWEEQYRYCEKFLAMKELSEKIQAGDTKMCEELLRMVDGL